MWKIIITIFIILFVWYIYFNKKEYFDNTKLYLIKFGDSYIKLTNNNAFIVTNQRNEAQRFNIKYKVNPKNRDGIYTITTINNGLKLYMGIQNISLVLKDKPFEVLNNQNFYLDKNKKMYIMESGSAKYLTFLLSTTANLMTAVDITFEPI